MSYRVWIGPYVILETRHRQAAERAARQATREGAPARVEEVRS